KETRMHRFLACSVAALALAAAAQAAPPPADARPGVVGWATLTLDGDQLVHKAIHEGKTNLLSKLGFDVDLVLSANDVSLVGSFLDDEVYKKTLARGPKHYSYCKD